MAQLLSLATKVFPQIASYPAELQLIKETPTSKADVDYLDAEKYPDPSATATIARAREVRAKVLRWLCADSEARKLVDPSGVRVVGAQVSGKLNLDFAEIAFPLSFQACWFEDQPSFWGTTLPMLDLSRSFMPGLQANLINVKRSLFLKAGFHSTRKVSIVSGQIGGYLEMEEGNFHGEGDLAVDAEGIHVDGSVLLSMGNELAGGPTPMVSKGRISFFRARIGGDVECTAGQFHQDPKDTSTEALDLHAAAIGGNLFLNSARSTAANSPGSPMTMDGPLNLIACSTNILVIDPNEKVWIAPGNLYLEGMTYKRAVLANDDRQEPLSADKMLRWLALDHSGSAQPYRQLATVLADYGDSNGATAALIEMEKRLSQSSDPAPERWLKASIGYGYRPENAFFGLLGVTVLGGLLLRMRRSAIEPSDENARKSLAKEWKLPESYPRFHPWVFSFENTFPLLKLGQTDKWRAAANSRVPVAAKGKLKRFFAWTSTGACMQWLIWVQIVVGWILATLFVAGVSGIVRHG